MAALYGLGAGAAQTIEDVLARKLLWERELARQAEANRSLTIAENADTRAGQKWDVERPGLEASVGVDVATAPEQIKQATFKTQGMGLDVAGKGIANQNAALDLGEKDRVFKARPDWAYPMMSVPPPAQPFMPMGEGQSPDAVNFSQQKELQDRSAQTQREIANIYGAQRDRAGMTDPQEVGVVNQLNRQYVANPSVKAALEMRRQLSLMRGAVQRMASGQSRDLNADSQAVLVTFQKILDPTSVVRESEYARSAQGQALMDRIYGRVVQLAKGGQGVPLDSLKNFLGAAEQMYQNVDRYRLAEQERIGRIADRYQLPRDLVLSEDVDSAPPETATPTGYANPSNVRRQP